ncbi:hypothetical protein J1N35_026020 [Gossypium stocksii]|uniref:Uncharacterized protein n=1 Tax=Gossypium stocksii TaxID=47602 RepID=A0A9D3V7B9_9ROSI|nr:hypothetical protein J1N35_026020 [Gossypium stocksii]
MVGLGQNFKPIFWVRPNLDKYKFRVTSAAGNTGSYSEDPNKKIRKPDTITKSKESWTEQEHDKSLEALQLSGAFVLCGILPVRCNYLVTFSDDLKMEAFVGSKTVIQIHSHAQKFFLKVQQSGISEHVPPTRPKRKAAHGYPQKAPKNATVVSQVAGPFQSSSALLNSGYTYRQDSSSMLRNPIATLALSSWNYNSVPPMMQHWLDHVLCIILVTVVATESLPELGCLVKPLMEGVMGRNLELCRILLRCTASLAVSWTPVQAEAAGPNKFRNGIVVDEKSLCQFDKPRV